MKTRNFLWLILLIWNSKAISQVAPQNIVKGIVQDSIICIDSPDQSYAVYTPSYYSSEKAWPIIYIFEPGARGVLPVKIFKTASEKWGYIIVGSNNSKNGNWQIVFDAADAMFVDTHKRFNIDQNRIYTSGFSGGGRAAIAVARLTEQVRGIIGCGAGSPNLREYQLNKENKVPYVGIVGDVDMNYLEVKNQEETFNEIGIKNIRLTWPSIHQWPPSHLIDKAIQWMEYQTNDTLSIARRKIIEKNFIFYRDSLFNSNNKREGVRLSKYIERDMNIKSEFSIIDYAASKEFKKEGKIIGKIEKRETSFRQIYFNEIAKISYTRLQDTDSIESVKWWKIEINKLQKKRNSKDINVQKMSSRLLNQIWASCAEKSFKYEIQQDYELALKLNEIWLHAQPTSTWGLWYRAKLYALEGDKEAALKYLEKAYDNGMSVLQSVTRQDAFKTLQQEPRYKDLISKLTDYKKTE